MRIAPAFFSLLDVEVLLDQLNKDDRVRQYALICSEQCYILRQINAEPNSVIQRIPYKQLKQIQAIPVKEKITAATVGSLFDFLSTLPCFRK